jgi:long-chain acyl-CoA synthetase
MPTLLHRLAQWSRENPVAPAQRHKKNGVWHTLTAQEYAERVYHLALWLDSKGFKKEEAGVIFAYNSPEWVHADLAVLLLGARSAGLYPNSNQKDIEYILNHTEATVLSVQNKEYFKKIGALPSRIRTILVFDGDTSIHPAAVSYESAISEGRKLAAQPGARTLQDLLEVLDPRAGAFMIYTSGTTGNPKGALLSQDNMVFTSDLASRYWGLPYARGSTFSFLPLCHIAEKLQCVGVGISQRYTVSFCTKFDNLVAELPEVQPTLLLCVPRLWEKMMEGVMSKLKVAPPARRKLAHWALAAGARYTGARFERREPTAWESLQFRLADRVVLSKIRQALGLGKVEMLASGAASLPAHVSKWFRSLGLEILEDFGQTESTGVICMTEPGVESAGTVGRGVPGIEVRIAGDGEILTRGRHVFVGYFKDPENTVKTVVDGWLHTGDLAETTPQGLIRIRGRKKEIMKTSGGKMIAPVPIEDRLKVADIISQVCMVGDGRKFFSALITLSDSVRAELEKRPGSRDERFLVTDREIVAQVELHVDALNRELASFERIKKFAVLAREFSIEDGEMTPTLKMKRAVIETRFGPVIDSFYQGAEE